MRIITALFIIMGFMPMNAQETPPRWQVGVHGGFSLAAVERHLANPLGSYNEALSPFETRPENRTNVLVSDFPIALDLNYTIFSFLRANFNFTYSGMGDSRRDGIVDDIGQTSLVRRSNVNFISNNLNACLDILYKDPYESLNIMVGLGYNLLYHRVYSGRIESFDASGAPLLINDFTRTMRQVRYFNLNLAAEWRDYITPHFGYFIRLSYVPLTQANTHSILLEKVQINGQTHPLEGETLKPGENGLPDENYEFQFINLSLGLTYQW